MSPSSVRIVEWYRVDPWPRMRRVLLVGPAVLTVGGLVIAVSFLTRQPQHVRVGAAILGFACVLSGACFTMVGMQRILRDEVCLAVRTDGLAVRASGSETLVPWDDLAEARWDTTLAALVLERQGQVALVLAHVFAEVGGPELARRLKQAKRRADLNMLR
jgi:hypothetical protein